MRNNFRSKMVINESFSSHVIVGHKHPFEKKQNTVHTSQHGGTATAEVIRSLGS